MKIIVDTQKTLGRYCDPTRWQNSTLRYTPPADFPAHLARTVGRAAIMRVFITLDEYWDCKTDTFYPDYDIGVSRYPVEKLHYTYDWDRIVPAPSGTKFKDYLISHAKEADELLLNVRRLEREVSDGVISYEQYEAIFEKAVAYCKALAPNLRYIECCNEVESKLFGNLTAAEYVKIYLCAHRAVKRLNAQNKYDIPLEIGGYAAAYPIHHWPLMQEVMRLLHESEIGDDPMDFYSYHHYEIPATSWLIRKGRLADAALSGVEKLKLILSQHEDMLAELGLPRRPVFLNELGKSRTTGIDGDALYNAAGVITYLLAFGCEKQPALYPFPWCSFHNPQLQMSYTQFVLREDGSYAMTPNGVAIKMLHDLSGMRLATDIREEQGKDTAYKAVATKGTDGYAVLITNPTGEIIACEVTLKGLPVGEYRLTEQLCDPYHNNCITAPAADAGDEITVTAEHTLTVEEGGNLHHVLYLEKDSFVLLSLTAQ